MEDMENMYAERVARDVKIALAMKHSELDIFYPNDYIVVGDGKIRLLTGNHQWMIMSVNKVEPSGNKVRVYDTDSPNAIYINTTAITDMEWDAL